MRTFYKVDKKILKKFDGDATPVIISQNMLELSKNNKIAFNVSKFAEDTGMSRTKVLRGIDKLIEAGMIAKTDKQTTYGKVIYEILPTKKANNFNNFNNNITPDF